MEKNCMKGVVERLTQHEAKLSAVFATRPCLSAIFLCIALGWQCFIWFKVFLVVLAMAFIWKTPTAPTFSYQTIAEYLYNIVDTCDLLCCNGQPQHHIFPRPLFYECSTLWKYFV